MKWQSKNMIQNFFPQHFSRLCVLVQDSYGMFSVVQLHLLPCKDDLHHYSHMWQGRTCLLRGIKVVQRVTRVRWDARCNEASIIKLAKSDQLLNQHTSHALKPQNSVCFLFDSSLQTWKPTYDVMRMYCLQLVLTSLRRAVRTATVFPCKVILRCMFRVPCEFPW